MLWEVDIYPAAGQPDRTGSDVRAAAVELSPNGALRVAAAHGYLVQGPLEAEHLDRIARE